MLEFLTVEPSDPNRNIPNASYSATTVMSTLDIATLFTSIISIPCELISGSKLIILTLVTEDSCASPVKTILPERITQFSPITCTFLTKVKLQFSNSP